MVAEAMILAGAVTAQFGIDRAIPLPFRSQLPADLPSPAQLDELPEGAVRFAAIKRCLSRGLMGTKPAAHFSLGLPAYVQATSPIRRYGDLVVQRQILACLDGASPCRKTNSRSSSPRWIWPAVRVSASAAKTSDIGNRFGLLTTVRNNGQHNFCAG